VKLTKAKVEGLDLPPGKAEAIFFDEDLPGFGLRLREGGSKNWIVQYALGAKQRRMTLGSIKMLDAVKARTTARELLARVELGQDPAAERRTAIAKASDEPLGTLMDRFLERQATRLRPSSYSATKRYLKELWKPLHALHLTQISRADVSVRLSAIVKGNGPVAADRARAALSAFFTWAVRDGLCDINPVVGTNKAADLKSRERVLSDSEMKSIWQALPECDYGRIVRLLFLTGQRREEIGGLRWSEIDKTQRLIRLPGERTKNHRAHDVPLTKAAIAILNRQPVRDGRTFVFGDGPRSNAQEGTVPKAGGFQGWSKSKSVLDEKTSDMQPWRLHDIRRTVATRMADLGVQPHIIEAVLNHVSGHKAGVAGVYNRAAYAAEKVAALELWAKHIDRLVSIRRRKKRDPRQHAGEVDPNPNQRSNEGFGPASPDGRGFGRGPGGARKTVTR
jgi:integrase